MLALAAFAASATTAELTVDVIAKSKWLSTNGTSSYDFDFKPTSFSLTFKFDLENPYQDLLLNAGYKPWAMTILNYSTTSSTKTPFTGTLAVAAPAGAYVQNPLTQLGLNRMLSEWDFDADKVLPTTDQILFTSSESWQTPAQGETYTKHTNWRGIEWVQESLPLSRNQLAKVSGEEFLAHLQSQVGKSFANAFYEDAWTGVYYDISSASTGFVQQSGTSIRGDIFIRSVAVVPEPGTFALSAIGLALMAGWRRRSMV